MKNKLIYILPLLTLCISAGCREDRHNSKRDQAVNLYYKSVNLIRLYTDSIGMAKDSATLLGMSDRFAKKMTDLNFQFPSETDLEISEGENDTLTNLTSKYVMLRDSLLYRFAHPLTQADSIAALAKDSLAKDSISAATAEKIKAQSKTKTQIP